MLNRVAAVEQNLDRCLAEARPASARLADDAPLAYGTSLTAQAARALFEDQLLSRQLDVTARELKRTNRSFYTISSAGHEQNAILGAQLRTTDPCLLHYRSGGLMMARARQHPGSTPVFDTLLGIVASSDDPTSGGRHKVWGSRETWVPPQTSTIASHLPKALGLAFALHRARRIGFPVELPSDSVVLCSFGDASLNHATALAGINSARYAFRHGNPTPILFVCEDNKGGISVPKPRRWIGDSYAGVEHLQFFRAEGDLVSMWNTAELAIHTCRQAKIPTFLHLRCVRLWGHAGSDVETTYHTLDEIEATEAADPLLANARLLIESGAATPSELAEMVRDVRERVAAAGEEASTRPKLVSLPEITAPLAPFDEERCRESASWSASEEERRATFGKKLPEEQTSATKRTLGSLLNAALHDEMAHRPEILIFGEDVGKKGGVYGLTKGLQETFGSARVFDTLLDETTILGLAQGAGQLGMLPICEIQYLAYIHNALDQIRGEACSLSFFSDGQFTNPMVCRVASFAYQKGFGGHFHNDHSFGALRDIPGLLLAAPSRGDDAVRMLRGVVATARENGRVACFLEPIALYHERDLHEPGDGGWLSDYPPPGEALLPGDIGVHGDGTDLCIASYANGLRLSLQAQRILERDHGVRARVVDLRWLNPLPHEALRDQVEQCGALLVVDECRETAGGIADALISKLVETGGRGRIGSVRGADSYVPLGGAANVVLVGTDDIVRGARKVLE